MLVFSGQLKHSLEPGQPNSCCVSLNYPLTVFPPSRICLLQQSLNRQRCQLCKQKCHLRAA